ncbi:argininosuccinate synthase [Hyaloraphidium curvatum]|nr:argininosuccinate synthase [Hyaloraphidium curvatum]
MSAAAANGAAAKRPKVCLAYSGGLDTSCILAWLIDEGYDVVCFIADIGQEEDLEAARQKGLKCGAVKVYVEDIRKEFVEETVFASVKANCLYEGIYLLGTSLARPIIARKQIEIAQKEGCDFVSHGATGKGNDQVRFEMGYYALQPSIKVIAPWRIPAFYNRFQGRQDLLEYAAEKGIPVVQTKKAPWSMDENLYHISFEAGILEDPDCSPPDGMWKLTANAEDAPNTPEKIEIVFKDGVPIEVKNLEDGTVKTDALELFLYLNQLGRKHGIGRIDIVENRFIGVKSRGCYETPGGTILRAAHVDIEGLTMDREVRELRDTLAPRLAKLIYNGFWFSPERDVIMAAVNKSQEGIDGTVKLRLFKGAISILGRHSPVSLYDKDLVSMDIAGGFEPTDSEGFIKVQSIRIKAYENMLKRKAGSKAVQSGEEQVLLHP